MFSLLYLVIFGQEVDIRVTAGLLALQTPFLKPIIYSLGLSTVLVWIYNVIVSSQRPYTGDTPLLLPVTVHHRRLIPVKHFFTTPYLMALVPVEYEGNAGGVLSVGRDSKLKPTFFGLARRCFWHIDPSDYMLVGPSTLSLRERLDIYLRSVNIDPSLYPKAHLVTSPKSLSIGSVPNSFWYLYSASGVHSLTVAEANAPSGTRRIYLVSKDPEHATATKGRFEKDVFITPFSPDFGTYSIRAPTPGHITESLVKKEKHAPFEITLGLLKPDFKSEFVAYIASFRQCLDPFNSSVFSRILLVLSHGWITWVIIPRTWIEGLRIVYQRGLPTRPTPVMRQGGPISRGLTRTEKRCEAVFKAVLKGAVKRELGKGVKIVHVPINSQGEEFGDLNGDDTVVIKPVVPEFYTAIVGRRHGTLLQALLDEEQNGTLSPLSCKDKGVLSRILHTIPLSPITTYHYSYFLAFPLIPLSLTTRSLPLTPFLSQPGSTSELLPYRLLIGQLSLANYVGYDVIAILQTLPFRVLAAWYLASFITAITANWDITASASIFYTPITEKTPSILPVPSAIANLGAWLDVVYGNSSASMYSKVDMSW